MGTEATGSFLDSDTVADEANEVVTGSGGSLVLAEVENGLTTAAVKQKQYKRKKDNY